MRKWLLGGLGLVAVIILGAAGYVLATGLRAQNPVGFQTVEVSDPKGPPIAVGIWYPTKAMAWPTLTGLLVQYVAREAPVDGKRLPLIILSHGIAGSLSSHADTALALADAGFVVAAPLHTGDNYKDQSAVGTTNWFPGRARHVHLTITYMLDEWRNRGHIDADKIGIFGFSAGGTTALIAAGGVPELDAVQEHCAKAKEFACDVWRSKHATAPDYGDFIQDPRIKAAVVIAPGEGFAFANGGTGGVRMPVQLWGGEKDESVPTASNAEIVHRELGRRAEWHFVPNAGHFSFMVPCGPAGLVAPAIICKDPAGFNRKAFHKSFNADVVAFFRKKLADAPRLICIRTALTVCFPQKYVDSFEATGMAGAIDAYGHRTPGPSFRGGLKIDAFQPDAIFEYSRIGLDLMCSKSWCVYYRKECDLSNTICAYMLMKPVHNSKEGLRERVETGMTLHIRAYTDVEFGEVQKDVTIDASGWLDQPEYLSLTAFARTRPMTDRIPSGHSMTQCDAYTQTPGCQPPLRDGQSSP